MTLAPHVRKVGYYLVPTVTLLPQVERWRKQAEALGLSREARKRLEWFIWYENKGRNASLTVRHFGITRCFHTWKKRFDGKNLKTLETRDRAPKKVPLHTSW